MPKGNRESDATEMSVENELKPCPFCGGSSRLLFDDTSDYREHWDWVIECANDECSCSFGHHQTKEKAIAAWNRRSTPPGTEMVPEWMEERCERFMRVMLAIRSECSAAMMRPGRLRFEKGIHWMASRMQKIFKENNIPSRPGYDMVPEGLDLDKLSSALAKVCTYIEKHEDLRPYSSLTPGKGLHTEILFFIAAIAASKRNKET